MESIQKQSFINGQWYTNNNEHFEVINPFTNKVVATVQNDGVNEINIAVQSASKAFDKWSITDAKFKSKLLYRWYELIVSNKDSLAKIMCVESGKTITECYSEINYGAQYVQWFAEEAKRINGDTIPGFTENQRILIQKKPVGVVGAITPWNFPLAMITRKVAAALAAGCTIIVRPSELTPLTALKLQKLAHEAGFPDGIYNTVVGTDASAMGITLCEHPAVAKITFTGSTKVGKMLMYQSASTLKKLSLELGGNAPFIVFEDADITLAIEGLIKGKFRFSGQTCVSINRVFVHKTIAENFFEQLKNKIENLILGDPLLDTTQIGPIIHKKSLERLQSYVDDATQKGAHILCGGCYENTIFLPTIITGVTPEMKLFNEEIFGPIIPIITFENENEVITLANQTSMGLASYFYTNNLNKMWNTSASLNFGMVGVNETMISSEMIPFGGVKQSGFEREGSKYGLDAYLDLQYVCIGNIK